MKTYTHHVSQPAGDGDSVCWRLKTDEREIEKFKVEVSMFVADFNLKSSIGVDIMEKTNIWGGPSSFAIVLKSQVSLDV